MSHRNARTTFQGRLLIVQRHQQRWPQAHIAKAMGISRKCVKTWLDRYAAEGEDGLHDRSSRPHTSPNKTSAAVEDRIVTARVEHRRGPQWLADELGVPARTISRVIARRGLPRPGVRRQPGFPGRVSPGAGQRQHHRRPRPAPRPVLRGAARRVPRGGDRRTFGFHGPAERRGPMTSGYFRFSGQPGTGGGAWVVDGHRAGLPGRIPAVRPAP